MRTKTAIALYALQWKSHMYVSNESLSPTVRFQTGMVGRAENSRGDNFT
jgi:hypothetical protein